MLGAQRLPFITALFLVGFLFVSVYAANEFKDAVHVERNALDQASTAFRRRILDIGDVDIDSITTPDEVTPEELEEHLATKKAAKGTSTHVVVT